MIKDWVVLGHHGTTAERAEAIADTGFMIKENEYDWLGHGVYFFERSQERAMEWASEQHPDSEVSVVAAEIALGSNGENCLNLAAQEGIRPLEDFFKFFVAHYPRAYVAGLKETLSGYRQFSCRVINAFCRRMEENGWDIHVIRSAFEEGDYIFTDPDGVFPTARLRRLTHIQVAVRNHDAIRDFWLDDQLPTRVGP